MFMFAILVGLTVHEFAHARAALSAGDDTAEKMGRVSLNPLDHLDPMGTLMMVLSSLSGFGFGWGKPVPVNHFRLRHPRWDSVRVSFWGPLANVITALILGMLVRFMPPFLVPWRELLVVCISVNLSLAMFNMIPIPPLDGSHILAGVLPAEQARAYGMFMGRYGPMILLGLIFFGGGIIGGFIGPPIRLLFRLFTGHYIWEF